MSVNKNKSKGIFWGMSAGIISTILIAIGIISFVPNVKTYIADTFVEDSTKYNDLKEENDTLSIFNKQYCDDINRLNNSITEKNSNIAELNTSVDRLTNDKNALLASIDELNTDIDNLENRVAQNNAQIALMQRMSNDLQTELSSANTRILN